MTDNDILTSLKENAGSHADLARELTAKTGTAVTPQRLSNWFSRGIPHQQRMTVVRLYAKKMDLPDDKVFDLMSGGQG